jgi:tryptophanyl-tRNA synthetase
MRPTGKLHLGNYVGALQNWVALQDEYECFFFIADWHALTTDYEDSSRVADNTLEVLLDWLGAGLNPKKCTMFVQSHVKQHAELFVLFSMITPLGLLERVPSYKEQQENLRNKDLSTYGFLGYPLLQAADILVYLADFVPVGEDQIAHVELTREIARRFNSFFPKWGPTSRHSFAQGGPPLPMSVAAGNVFPEPQPLLTRSPKLLGSDGRKMSKSYNNSILLSEQEGSLKKKIMNSVTDRPKLTDRGNPERCPVGNLHLIFSDPEKCTYISHGCTHASIRCIDCKALAFESVNDHLRPIREERRRWAEDRNALREIILEGAENASKAAEETMITVRQSVGLLNQKTLKRYAPELVSEYQSGMVRTAEEQRVELFVNGSFKGNIPAGKQTLIEFVNAQAQLYGLRSFSVLVDGRQVRPDQANCPLDDYHASKIEIGAMDVRASSETEHREIVIPRLPLEALQGIPDTQKGDLRRAHWLQTVTKTYPLRPVGHRTFVTLKNRRIGVPTSGEHAGDRWMFSIGDRTYDALVLLCHTESGEIIDFLIPRKFLKGWEFFKRDGKNVVFEVRQLNRQFFLRGVPEAPQNITEFKQNYSVLE